MEGKDEGELFRLTTQLSNVYQFLVLSLSLIHHRFNVRVSALARVERFPKMLFFHKTLTCASSLLNSIFLISSATLRTPSRFSSLFLFPSLQHLTNLYMLKPNHLRLSAPHARSTLSSRSVCNEVL